MNQSQAVVSAAILEAIWASRKKDMIDLITPFILYAVAKKTSPGGAIDTKAVQEYVQVNNAYPDLPESIVKAALSRNPYSAIEKREKRFYLTKALDEEVDRIDQREKECRSHISAIGVKLSQYLSDHCQRSKQISQENAIDKLHSFFTRYGLEVGTENLASVQIKPEDYEADYYIARFIFECKDSNDLLYDSIIDLVKGYLLRLAIYIQPENGNIQSASFANTSFVLDTPILLSLLGYLGEERKNNALSLVKMLSQQYAKLYYFPHIKQEIINILTAYKYSLMSGTVSVGGKTLEGLDLRGFNISDVEREIQMLESKLEGVFHITEHAMPAYITKADNTVDERQVLGEEEIKQYIRENTTHYTEDNLNNDIESVLAIHKLRKGISSPNIESCCFVFVTNNVDFIHAFNKYYRENVDNETFQLAISSNALSAITWIKCGEVSNLSETELLKNAYCAMQPIPEIMMKVEEVLSKLKDSGNISPDQVVALRASRVFQNDLWVNSFGNVEAINEFSVKTAQKKYEEFLIRQEKEKHSQEIQAIDSKYSLEMKDIQNKMSEQTQSYNERISEMSRYHDAEILKMNEDSKLQKRKQMETIRKKADELAECARKEWLVEHMHYLNLGVWLVFMLGIAGLFASITLSGSLWISVLLVIYLLISAFSVYETVFSKRAFWVKKLEKRSYIFATKVREEKLQEYRSVLENQDTLNKDVEKQFATI